MRTRRRQAIGQRTSRVAGGAPVAFSLVDVISYWKLDEASGDAVDSHGSNTLTDNNTVTTAAGKIGTARQFTKANNESLSIADNAALSTGDIDFSVTCWVYLDTKTVEMAIVGKYGTGVDQREWLLEYDNGTDRFRFIISSNGTDAGRTNLAADVLGSPSTGTWYFIAAWHDSVNNTLNVQVNNGTADSVSYSSGTINGTSSFEVGVINGATIPFDGRIDEMLFAKRVLTAAERTTLYNNGAGRAYPFA